jgi:hypothetical protein
VPVRSGYMQRLWGAQKEKLATPRGIAAVVVVLVLLISSVSSNKGSGGAVVGILILLPILWWIAWLLLGFAGSFWAGLVAGGPPQVSVGRAWQSSSGRHQLRQDNNGEVFVDRGGILLKRRAWFIATGTPPVRLDPIWLSRARREQATDPVQVVSHRDRHYWWHRDAFYWTNAEHGNQDIKALLFARERQRERELEHAHALLAASTSPAARKREPIPKDAKLAVWRRDEGHCVECASDFDLQYDHIIPFSMGGADSVDNLQLLCARCNQVKGGRL